MSAPFPPSSLKASGDLSLIVAEVLGQFLSIPPPDPAAMRRIGFSVFDHLRMHALEVLPGATRAMLEKAHETIAQRFLEYALPKMEEIDKLPPDAAKEYLIALQSDLPDVGRIMVGFALARGPQFAQDRHLKFRCAGYRAGAGNPLADHLIENVVRPVARQIAKDQ